MSDPALSSKINSSYPAAKPLPRPGEVNIGYECADSGQSLFLPINISPPLLCSEISQVPAEFIELRSAYNNYSKSERQSVNRLAAARDSVAQLGVNLFKSALLDDHPRETAVRLWREYLGQAKKMNFDLDGVRVLQSLSDPKMDPADRRLLFGFVTGNKLSPELASRFLHHDRQSALEYNGWQGNNYKSASTQFLKVIAEFYDDPYSYERFQAALVARQPFNHLVYLSGPEAENYLRCERSIFLQKYAELRNDLEETPPGSLQRIDLSRKINDLGTIALARGISLIDENNSQIENLIPHLAANEYGEIFRLDYYARLADGRSDSIYTKRFKQAFENFALKYLKADDRIKRNYASVLHMFDSLAVKYGVRGAELDDLLYKACLTVGCELKGKDRIPAMANLDTLNSADVSPEGLPREIRELLVKTGYWELVRDNLYSIFFTTDISAGGYNIKPGGTANPLLRRVEIDFNGADGKILAPWEIAAVLVHEAAHVAWRFQPPLLQNSTPNERHAYATELAFFVNYDKLFGPPEDAAGFSRMREQATRAVKTANQIIGYPPNDLSPDNTGLPESKFCRERGVASADELDLSYYPTNPDPSFMAAKSDFDKLTRLYPALDPATARLLWEMVEGRAELILSATVRAGVMAGRPGLTLDRSGEKLELTPQQVDQLKDFFNLLLLPTGYQAKSPYSGLAIFGSQQKGSLTKLNKHDLLTLLRRPIKLELRKIIEDLNSDGTDYRPELVVPGILGKFPRVISRLGQLLVNRRLPASFDHEDLQSALAYAKELVINPNKIVYFNKLVNNKEIKAADRLKLALVMDVYKLISAQTKDKNEILALIDLISYQISESIDRRGFQSSYRISAASLRSTLNQYQPGQ